MARVSVLIPVYNGGRYLAAALDSVYAQTYSDFEVLIVDDGSEDDTPQVAARYPAARYVRIDHSGVATARNTAVRMSDGELVAFLDADDLWKPEKLEKQVRYLDAHPACQLVFTETENFFDGDPAEMNVWQKQVMAAPLRQNMASLCIRREIFSQFPMYREDLTYGEDSVWLTNLSIGGTDCRHTIPEVLYLRRVHTSNLTLQTVQRPMQERLQLMAQAIRQARKTREQTGE